MIDIDDIDDDLLDDLLDDLHIAKSIHEISEVIGMPSSLKLAKAIGGGKVYIGKWHDDPTKRTTSMAVIVATIGENKAKVLVNIFACSHIDVPRCANVWRAMRNRLIMLYLKDNTVQDTARKFQLTQNQLRNIMKKHGISKLQVKKEDKNECELKYTGVFFPKKLKE